jgi:hypothetical protein
MFLSTYQIKAQLCVPPSGYNINNNNAKTVIVAWEIVDPSCNTIKQGVATISPGGTFNIPLTSFTGAANDIYVVLSSIAGAGTCNNNSVNGTSSAPCNNGVKVLTQTGFEYQWLPGCSSGSCPWTMNWFCDHVDVN